MHELIGSIEDIDIRHISPSRNTLRSVMQNVIELAYSIKRIGLLQPIIVRANETNFEIIAGNRRLKACKMLGLKKISCHIVQLDDRSAFEVSLIENVQKHSLNAIEEGQAFKKYVHEFGWGGTSELAQKISKSPSYVSRRIKLVNLPRDILDLISLSAVNITTAEELFTVTDKETVSKLTELTRDEHLSSRTVRKLVKGIASNKVVTDSIFCNSTSTGDYDRICKSLDKAIIVLRIAIKRLATIIEKIEDKWIFYDIMMQHKHALHHHVDLLIKEKTKYKKNYLLLRTIDKSLR
jgi:ParB family transcriptional regulator, chromosome partitioning protein